MDDRFMHELKADPPPAFAEQLRTRLASSHPDRSEGRPSRRAWATVVALAVFVGLFALPSVRTSAQAFLNLFRVVNFAAIPVDVSRLDTLTQNGIDLTTMIGQQVEVLENPGAPRVVSTLEEAATAAGMPVKLPGIIPPGLVMSRVEVEGGRAARIKADTRKLQDVMDALAITDLTVPGGLDGQLATVRVPPIVRLTYAVGDSEVSFMQAKSPEVTMPGGLDLARLGEIGLRIAGIDAGQAHTLAQAIDWGGTLIVPVPAGVSSFRQVDIKGSRGLLVTAKEGRNLKAVMWSNQGAVYGIRGPLNDDRLLQMALSVP